MAKKPSVTASSVDPRRSTTAAIEYPTTQRAYTLRLRGQAPQDNHWRDALWATHEAINIGAKVFGDWLLTLRGGISHECAEPPPPAKKKDRSESETAELRKARRILLALSWLSVEDDHGAPKALERVATGAESDQVRAEKTSAALRSILSARRVAKHDIESWLADCADSLASKIRDDAVWINRSAAFDAARQQIGSSLTREEVWDILEPFFASREAYLSPVDLADDEDSGEEDKAKDLVQKAGQWLSSRFGTGVGADFSSMAKVYAAMAKWADGASTFRSGAAALASLGESLSRFHPESHDADGVLSLISGPGYKSATRNIIKSWGERAGPLPAAEIAKFAEIASEDEAKCSANVGGKGRRPWSDRVLAAVEQACGFTYLQKDGPARHSEFAVMLDHAARRVSISHSWIKRAEAERRRFEQDAERLAEVPADAAAWLDRFILARSDASGATAAGGEYRIRRRAVEGWDEVIKRWKRASCKTVEDRIAAAREVQSDPDIDKFGDIQLFEALAVDDAECVWRQGGRPTTETLRDYVLGHDARNKQRRFKVPAYRHPDPLRHPVFGDFGNSRWNIEYAVHEASKSVGTRLARDPGRAAWLKDLHGLRLGLWNGNSLQAVSLRWSSKRLKKDLALPARAGDEPRRDVARADRLGRAAVGITTGELPRPSSLLGLADWNGRLQAPRVQLDAIADHVAKHGWDARAKKMRNRINWLVSFSAKLECRGPFHDFVARFDDQSIARPFVSRKGDLAVKHDSNEKRQGHAKLVLSRLPGLRILSVDLGHRFAAACAVWESISSPAFKKEIAGREVIAGGQGRHDLFFHTRHVDPMTGKTHTTVYRRIGEDFLRDPKSGKATDTPHPAPWARLDRQFLIKLQGEESPARMRSSAEADMVRELEKSLGRVRDPANPLPSAIDELMAEAVRSLRLALRRLGDAARVAYAFKPDAVRHTPGGGTIAHTQETRTEEILDALLRWSDLAHGERWKDEWAAIAWRRHIKCDIPTLPEDADRSERKRHRAAIETQLAPMAAALASGETKALHELWSAHWKEQDAEWCPRLKEVRRWILPRGLRPQPGDTPAQAAARAARRAAARHVGGLSLTRIATIRELYQLQKAFAMRPAPDNPRRNIAAKGDDRFDEFGRSVLDVMERLREQRVKQTASRIVEAALGVGRHSPAHGKSPDRKRPQEQKDPPCHAIVIENLRNYRPDELQTRRENRALMSWASGKVRKHLEEGCQLHGLYLREVMPNYTSRQCSRTGLPGMRCADVPIDDFLNARYWAKVVASARKRLQENGADSLDTMIRDLYDHWSTAEGDLKVKQRTLRVPRTGADLFVAATSSNHSEHNARALQADLNAAANIGLRALLDPDFIGKWWYVPCDSSTGKPAKDKCAGAACLPLDVRLDGMPTSAGAADGAKAKAKPEKEVTNAWRDVGSSGSWRVHAAYWNDVKARVVQRLRVVNGLPPSNSN